MTEPMRMGPDYDECSMGPHFFGDQCHICGYGMELGESAFGFGDVISLIDADDEVLDLEADFGESDSGWTHTDSVMLAAWMNPEYRSEYIADSDYPGDFLDWLPDHPRSDFWLDESHDTARWLFRGREITEFDEPSDVEQDLDELVALGDDMDAFHEGLHEDFIGWDADLGRFRMELIDEGWSYFALDEADDTDEDEGEDTSSDTGPGDTSGAGPLNHGVWFGEVHDEPLMYDFIDHLPSVSDEERGGWDDGDWDWGILTERDADDDGQWPGETRSSWDAELGDEGRGWGGAQPLGDDAGFYLMDDLDSDDDTDDEGW